MTQDDVLFFACCSPEVAGDTGKNYRAASPEELAAALTPERLRAFIGRFEAERPDERITQVTSASAENVTRAMAAYHLSYDGAAWQADSAAVAARDADAQRDARAQHAATNEAMIARVESELDQAAARRSQRATALGQAMTPRSSLIFRLAHVDQMIARASSSEAESALTALRDEIEGRLPTLTA